MSGRLWDEAAAARSYEAKAAGDLESMDLPSPHECFKQIRTYLQRMCDTRRTKTGVRVLSQRTLENGDMQINAGPSIYRHPREGCVEFQSGAFLKFGATLRFHGVGSKLIVHSFHLQLEPTSRMEFVRIDLNDKEASNPLHVPRSHLHPGFQHVHIPFPVMRPLEILDRLVHVIEPAFRH
ncbi:MAG: hypothetical protein IT167_28645 [Bryobacterales bacterium]|nr:hypothetical protein [Bryobacterales bacterium]